MIKVPNEKEETMIKPIIAAKDKTNIANNSNKLISKP
jgi:hypothetical protein